MQLYAGSSKQFVDDAIQNRIAEKLTVEFRRHYNRKPGEGEFRSWQNSLSRMCNIIQHAQFFDQGVILEYRLPLSSKRLDFLIAGEDSQKKPNAVVVELKQWDSVEHSHIDDCVVTYVGKGLRDVLHPSRQVGNYQQFLLDYHTAFSSEKVGLASCSYLHNLQFDPTGELFHARYTDLLKAFPLFTGDQSNELVSFLNQRVGNGGGQDILATIRQSKYQASKKLLEHTSAIIKRQKVYTLLDEQQVVFNAVLAEAKAGFHDKSPVTILVNGGPGTGKSVIAMNLVAELSAMHYNAHYVTGSRAFTENVRKVVGSRAGVQFKYTDNYALAEPNAVDVLIMDEAHRIRKMSPTRFTPAHKRSGLTQIEEIMRAAKVVVFFIDDLQVVRPGEIGSSDFIREGAAHHGAVVKEFELEAQFRCNGSDGFINWINNTLDIRPTANVFWDTDDEFDFQILDSVQELETKIRQKQAKGHTARLTAGFCWPWSDPEPGGQLKNDVQIGDWGMPWNAKPDSTRLAAGVPKSHYWASDPNGINQVGCVYTAQGFEYDYAGVIFGLDLRYDPESETWVGDRTQSQDRVVRQSGDAFLDLIKNTYRVLLTRGLKGCYLYFQDDATRDYFRSLMKSQPDA